MKISIFGLGYDGCVSAACLAGIGNEVDGLDVNPLKTEILASGRSPVIEPDLDDLVSQVVRSGRLRIAANAQMAVNRSAVSMICVGTPSNGNGSVNLDFVKDVCREIGEALSIKDSYHTVVVRSTVLPGSVENVLLPILERSSGKTAGSDFGICMNPEFLREGSAIQDYLHPSYMIVGELDSRSGAAVREMYRNIDAPLFHISIREAEMIKYTSNAFHALKIVFANEIGSLSKALGIDGQKIMEIICRDRKLNISSSYLKPGFAFGGSCLPKDVRGLLYKAKELDVECELLRSILPSNQNQIRRGIHMVEKTGLKKIGILGVSFKPGTDDLRESPAVILAETLLGKGYAIKIFDDKVQLSRLMGANKIFLEKELPHIASLICPSMEELVAQSEVVVITNESEMFHNVHQLLNSRHVLIDLVGCAKNNRMPGFGYEGIGW